MAKVTRFASIMGIQSEYTLKEIESVKKFHPEALELKDDNGDVMFSVTVGAPSVSKFGISFGEETNGSAVVLVKIPEDMLENDFAEFVYDNYSRQLINLHKIEEQMASIADVIEKEMNEIEEMLK